MKWRPPFVLEGIPLSILWGYAFYRRYVIDSFPRGRGGGEEGVGCDLLKGGEGRGCAYSERLIRSGNDDYRGEA